MDDGVIFNVVDAMKLIIVPTPHVCALFSFRLKRTDNGHGPT